MEVPQRAKQQQSSVTVGDGRDASGGDWEH